MMKTILQAVKLSCLLVTQICQFTKVPEHFFVFRVQLNFFVVVNRQIVSPVKE